MAPKETINLGEHSGMEEKEERWKMRRVVDGRQIKNGG